MAKTKKTAEPAPAPAYMATRGILLPNGQQLTEGECLESTVGLETGTIESLTRIGALVPLDDSAPGAPAQPPAAPLVSSLEVSAEVAAKLAQFTTLEELVKYAAANNGLAGLELTEAEIAEVNAALELALEG